MINVMAIRTIGLQLLSHFVQNLFVYRTVMNYFILKHE